ncbi:MAG TPA: cytochrome P450 [Jiangellales bacterium]|nr:cytochrome P450 [Jiangellales bacterium]
MTCTHHLPLPPLAPGLPLLGNAMGMMGDVQAFFVRHYRMLGPIFRVRALNQAFTIMAGAEANHFLRTQGEEYFSNQDTMGGLNKEFHMRVHVLTGRAHRHLRKHLGSALSRDLLAARWDHFVALTERRIHAWCTGKSVPVVDQFQRLAAEQLSTVLTGAATTAQFDLLRRAFELVLEVTVTGKWPAAALRLPTYRKARAKILAFAHAALAERAAHPHGGPPDLLDHALAATDEHGRPYPPDVRAGMALQGYFAGINTVAYLYSFMLYALLRHPDVLARVTGEVNTILADGRPSFDALRDMRTLQGLVLETLRVYPPAPGSARTAVKPFRFNGFRVDGGTRVLVATTVPHHLAEHYSDPHVFDIDRAFLEKRRNDVYAPFSVGPHTCLGAGLTEVLAAATMAILVQNVRLRLPSPDYRLRIQASPGPNPGRRFKVNVLGARPA